MRQGIAHEVDAAVLPDCAEDLGDGRLYALMGIGDYELHAAQAPASQAAQEVGPEGLGLGMAIAMPSTSRRPSPLTPTAMMTATDTIRPARRTLM